MSLINRIISNGLRTSIFQIASRSFHALQSFSPVIALVPSPSLTLQVSNIQQNFLKPLNLIVNQTAGFKVKGRLRRRCKDCFFVRRQERLYVICKTHPRHKQMSMKAKDYKSWILTHATQSRVRPY